MNVEQPTAGQDTQCKNRRIASNTLVLFGRMLLLTLVNLYVVRLVMKGLGEEDYGIFNTVASVVTVSVCISSVLELSMQRFYAIAMGEQDKLKLNAIFSSSVNIVLVLSLLILILFETAGLWFLHTQLVIPASRMAAAAGVYQFALITFLCTILQIPFTAAIFAHEEMGIYALVSTADCLLRLSVALLIGHFSVDPLLLYSGGLMLTAMFIFMTYAAISRHRYAECHYQRPHDSTLYKSILFFSSWTLYGSLANVGIVQGSTILLNIFFGPVIIAAFAVSQQISNAFNTLSNSIVLSIRPAMMKAYAEKNFHYLNQLFSVSNKFLLYILLAIGLPLIAEMDTVLTFWLGDVSPNMILFARLIIVNVICLTLHHPITIIMQASGRVQQYHSSVESITLFCLPLTWLFFLIGCPPFFVYIAMLTVYIMAHVVRLYCLRRYYPEFSLSNYLWAFICPAIVVVALVALSALIIHTHLHSGLFRLALTFSVIPLLVLLSAYLLGMTVQERQLVSTLFITPLKQRLWNR